MSSKCENCKEIIPNGFLWCSADCRDIFLKVCKRASEFAYAYETTATFNEQPRMIPSSKLIESVLFHENCQR